MKLPKSLNILGFKYTIGYTNDKNYLNDGTSICYGVISPSKNLIFIDNTYPQENQLQTLCHEVIHAIDYITAGNEGYSLTEKQTDLLATGIASVILNNNIGKDNDR